MPCCIHTRAGRTSSIASTNAGTYSERRKMLTMSIGPAAWAADRRSGWTGSPSVTPPKGWTGMIVYPARWRYAATLWLGRSGFRLRPTTAMRRADRTISATLDSSVGTRADRSMMLRVPAYCSADQNHSAATCNLRREGRGYRRRGDVCQSGAGGLERELG